MIGQVHRSEATNRPGPPRAPFVPVTAAAVAGRRTRDVCAAIAFLFADGIDAEIYDAISDPDHDLVELIDHLVDLRREVNRP